MPLNLTKLIIEAQKKLILQPHDLAHDVIHHYRVCEWCRKIVAVEKLAVDWQKLSLSAWWHDVERKEKNSLK